MMGANRNLSSSLEHAQTVAGLNLLTTYTHNPIIFQNGSTRID